LSDVLTSCVVLLSCSMVNKDLYRFGVQTVNDSAGINASEDDKCQEKEETKPEINEPASVDA